MRAGLLRNYLIDIYSLTTIRDDYGGEQETYTLTFGNVRCNISDFHEDRKTDAYEVEYEITRKFTIRRNYKSSLNEHCRILYESNYYRVDSIENSKDNNNIIITAKKINL